uniref:GH26 domain-containing protein n=1 Tax=Craspedostauros australis TaxID=1486917 RepID=A0A6T6HVZ4_9STRA
MTVKDTSCQPAAGHTWLTIGQDLLSIQRYVTDQYDASLHRNQSLFVHELPHEDCEDEDDGDDCNEGDHGEDGDEDKHKHHHKKHHKQHKHHQHQHHEDHSPYKLSTFQPSSYMVYTDIQTLHGLDTPVDYGSGVEFASGLLEYAPGSGLQLGLWLNGLQGCQDILAGNLDDNIKRLFDYLHDAQTPKVFLRIGYEFDNPSFGYSDDPQAFRDAYTRLVDMCEEQMQSKHHHKHRKHDPSACREKIAFVWHSWSAPRVVDLSQLYPGDDYVDWVGVSVFQQFYPWAPRAAEYSAGAIEDLEEVMDFAQNHSKPIMIAESTPFGGIKWESEAWQDNLMQYGLDNETVDVWDMWFAPTLSLIEKYDIGMWSYIDCDWEALPQWKGVGFGDTRLVQSQRIMELWYEHVLHNPRFQHELECIPQDRDNSHKSDGNLSIIRGILADGYHGRNRGNDQVNESQHSSNGVLLPVLLWFLAVAAVFLIVVKHDSSRRRRRQQGNALGAAGGQNQYGSL